MTTSDKFDYVTNYGTYKDCTFEVNSYRNGNIYLGIVNEEEGNIITCTVNGNRVNGDFEVGIKNYSENEGMVDFLQKLGIIEKEPIANEFSGFVLIPYFKLTESGKQLVNFLEN